jgi:hypothetical protein
MDEKGYSLIKRVFGEEETGKIELHIFESIETMIDLIEEKSGKKVRTEDRLMENYLIKVLRDRYLDDLHQRLTHHMKRNKLSIQELASVVHTLDISPEKIREHYKHQLEQNPQIIADLTRVLG